MNSLSVTRTLERSCTEAKVAHKDVGKENPRV